MPARGSSKDEVVINGIYFPIIGQVQEFPQNIFPPKRVDGDYTRDSNPRLSSITFSDFRGGIGLDIMQGNETNRFFSSSLNTGFKRSMTLAPLVVQTQDATTLTVAFIGEYSDVIYAAWGNDVWTYDNGLDNWSDTLHDLGTSTTTVRGGINVLLSGTQYLIIASGSNGYSYWNNSSWQTSAKSTVAFADWDNRLWGISLSGQLWYAFVPGTETDDAQILSNASASKSQFVWRLFTGPDAAGENILYASTVDGLYAHDAANASWVKTDVPSPRHVYNGRGAGTWNGRIYFSQGLTLLEYDPRSGFGRNIGLDLADGLPPEHESYIANLGITNRRLYVSLRSDGNGTSSTIYAWDGVGWELLYDTSATLGNMDPLLISSSYGDYRVWTTFNQSSGDPHISYQTIPLTIQSPKRNTAHKYAASGNLKTPWFHADQVDVDKLAVRAKVETSDTSTSGTVENVKVEYAVDYDEGSSDANYLTLANSTFTDGLIDTDDTGVTTTTFVFPLDSVDTTVAPVGKAFKAIRFKVSETRGGTNTNSPRWISLTLEYRKKLDYKQGFRVQLDLTKRWKEKSPSDLRASLQTILESTTLVEFTYRNDTGETRNFYVDMFLQQGLEQTGYDERGTAVVDLLEA